MSGGENPATLSMGPDKTVHRAVTDNFVHKISFVKISNIILNLTGKCADTEFHYNNI